MSARALSLATAVAVAAVLATAMTAAAKDDPAVIKANREAVRKKYKDAKKVPFGDLSYFVDSTKLKDQRWEFRDMGEPSAPDEGGHMFSATFPSGNASDPAPSITFNIFRSPHFKMESSSSKSVFQHEFKSWGHSVPVSKADEMATGFFEDFKLECKDFIKEKSKASDKKPVGVAKYWGYAVGTDKEAGKRVRKDWYLWVQNGGAVPFTWIGFVTTSDKFIDTEGWMDKVTELMKNVKELEDDKLK